MPVLNPPPPQADREANRRAHRFTEALSVQRLLGGVPMRNRAVRQRRGGDALVLELPLRARWWNRAPLTWLFPVRSHRRFALDTLGRQVWEAVDDERDVETIIENFAHHHRLGFHEARVMVTAFLKTLVQRNLLVLSVEAPVSDEAHDPSGETDRDPLGGDA